MKTIERLIEIVKSNSRKEEGKIQTNDKGIKYQYVTYILDTPFHWVVKMFEKAQIEYYGGTPNTRGGKLNYDYKRIQLDKLSIFCEYSNYKGQAPKRISINELIIIK